MKYVYLNSRRIKITLESMLLEGYIEFDKSIPVSIDCLGKKFPISISGVNGFLITPLMFEGFYGTEKLGPLKQPDGGNMNYIDSFYWGSVKRFPTGDSNINACRIIFPDIDKEIFNDIGNKIINELSNWRELFIDNISVDSKKDFRCGSRNTSLKRSSGTKLALYKKLSGSDNEFRPSRPIQQFTITIDRFCFTPESLQRILTDTSENKKPLLPFYFFLDAQSAKCQGNYRKSILDAATALELAFTIMIDKLFEGQEKFRKHLTSKHNSLRLKRELLKALQIELQFPEKMYVENLDNTRNRVIHAGYNPNKLEAENALRISRDTLYNLFPSKYQI